MKHITVCLALALGVAAAAPAYAQLGGLGRIRQNVDRARKIADLNISDKDERAIGEAVSQKLVDHFGVYQDAQVTKYVALVGTALALDSSRPKLDWKFIVLDTDGVNAYAAPGGIVHITRGALALIKSEAELAGVLGHELTHVTARHTINAIKKGKLVDIGSDEVSGSGGIAGALIGRLADVAYDHVIENKFDRDDELESDKVGVTLANKVGYAPHGFAAFLTKLSDRNKARQEPNGLFASHPLLKERVEKIGRIAKEEKLASTATAEARYQASVKVNAKPMAEIAMVPIGVRGAASGSATASNAPAKPEEKKEEPKEQQKKKGFGLGSIAGNLTGGRQAESTQASASAGGRMVGPDTNAAGGPNKNRVNVTVTPADVAEFKKGIA